jgi:hypothetical protein
MHHSHNMQFCCVASREGMNCMQYQRTGVTCGKYLDPTKPATVFKIGILFTSSRGVVYVQRNKRMKLKAELVGPTRLRTSLCNHILHVVPWLRRLVAILSPRRPNFFSRFSSYGIYDGQSGTGTGLSPRSLVFPRIYHSTVAPYSYIIWRVNSRPVSGPIVSPHRH